MSAGWSSRLGRIGAWFHPGYGDEARTEFAVEAETLGYPVAWLGFGPAAGLPAAGSGPPLSVLRTATPRTRNTAQGALWPATNSPRISWFAGRDAWLVLTDGTRKFFGHLGTGHRCGGPYLRGCGNGIGAGSIF